MTRPQIIIIFQQNGSGESKIRGIRDHGNNLFELECFDIGVILPPIIDDADDYLPQIIHADLVLDFLKHPDLSYDLALLCRKNNIPVVASGKKIQVAGTFTPPT